MFRKSRQLLILITACCALISVAASAKKERVENDNLALIIGEAGESYPVYGTGGIKVKGGHHGIFASNTKSSEIQIDGSGVLTQKYMPSYMQADFQAAPNGAFFVTNTAVCTMPPATGVAGQEIIVCNTSSSGTITYKTLTGEPLPGSDSTGALAGAAPGKVDKFISDGKTWYKE